MRRQVRGIFDEADDPGDFAVSTENAVALVLANRNPEELSTRRLLHRLDPNTFPNPMNTNQGETPND